MVIKWSLLSLSTLSVFVEFVCFDRICVGSQCFLPMSKATQVRFFCHHLICHLCDELATIVGCTPDLIHWQLSTNPEQAVMDGQWFCYTLAIKQPVFVDLHMLFSQFAFKLLTHVDIAQWGADKQWRLFVMIASHWECYLTMDLQWEAIDKLW